jgi:hypothetical protein
MKYKSGAMETVATDGNCQIFLLHFQQAFSKFLKNKCSETLNFLFCLQLSWLSTIVRSVSQGGYDVVDMKFGWWRQEVFTEFWWGNLEGKRSVGRLGR